MNVLGAVKRRSEDYKKGYDLGFQKGVQVSVRVLMFGLVQYLGDKRGWKRERIFEALQWLHKHAEMQVEDYTTFDEVVEAVKKEYGIVIDNDGVFHLLTESEWRNQT